MNSPYGDRTQRLDLAQISVYTRGVIAARDAYRDEHPVVGEPTLPCVCGGMFATPAGLRIHVGRWCPGAKS